MRIAGEDLTSFPPRPMPGRTAIEGHGLCLEPLCAADHARDLWASLGHDADLWTYLPYGPFADRTDFDAWLAGREGGDDPRHMTILVEGRPLGSLAFMALRPEMGVAEIGHVVLGPRLQKSRAATAAFALAIAHLFDLGYRRIEWKCDSANAPSRNAALRLGFQFEGLFRQHMVVKGRNRDTAWFSLIDREWPAIAEGFRRWLDPANFDESGRQRRRLADMIAMSQ
jgi:RimJ/RimL family protein N-acetyltransferase